MQKKKTQHPKGIAIAALITAAWLLLLSFLLFRFRIDFWQPWVYLFVLLQTHLYTGLFITAHDAMHGVAAPGRPRLNKIIGTVTALLFAFNWYPRLLPRHHAHHQFVATAQDPDFHGGSFLRWYLSFLKQYLTLWQLLLMAITFNLLRLFLPTENVVLFWMLPSVLSTLQLFHFGTYLPHRGEHAPENKHKSSSQPRNHVFAFVSCYFFGYHYEHHEKPYVPWWQLYREKS